MTFQFLKLAIFEIIVTVFDFETIAVEIRHVAAVKHVMSVLGDPRNIVARVLT